MAKQAISRVTAPIKLLLVHLALLEAVDPADIPGEAVAKNVINAVKLGTLLVIALKVALVDTVVGDIKVEQDSAVAMGVVAALEDKRATLAVAMAICRATVRRARSATIVVRSAT